MEHVQKAVRTYAVIFGGLLVLTIVTVWASTWQVATPAGIIVGVQSILDRQLMLGQILTVVTLSPDTGGEISERFLVTGAINTGDFQLDSGSLFADVYMWSLEEGDSRTSRNRMNTEHSNNSTFATK